MAEGSSEEKMALRVREKWNRFFGGKDPAVIRLAPATEKGFNQVMKTALTWDPAERAVTGLILTGLFVEALLEIGDTLVEIRDELRKGHSPERRPEAGGAVARARSDRKAERAGREEGRRELREEREKGEEEEEREEPDDNDDPPDDDSRGGGDVDDQQEEP